MVGSCPSPTSDKVFFPQSGFTKGQLIDYYVRIAEAMLPHIRERPLTMRRFPNGVEGKSFFEKHIPSHAPGLGALGDRAVHRRTRGHPLRHGERRRRRWPGPPTSGNIEFHVPLWHVGRRRKLPAQPDYMVFDLDPGEGTSIVECCVVAGYIMDELDKDGMESFAKTSGSKGLQLYAPVGPKSTWDEPARPCARDRPQVGVGPP